MARIVIPKGGKPRMIVTQDAQELVQAIGGTLDTIRRASRVEVTHELPATARQVIETDGRLRQVGEILEARLGETDRWQPADLTYWADLSPVHGPVLGGFVSHAEAVSAEIAWLTANQIPVAEPPNE